MCNIYLHLKVKLSLGISLFVFDINMLKNQLFRNIRLLKLQYISNQGLFLMSQIPSIGNYKEH